MLADSSVHEQLMRLKGVVQRIRKRIINNVGRHERKKADDLSVLSPSRRSWVDLVEDRLRTMYLACLEDF